MTGRALKLTTPNDVLTARDSLEYWSQKHMAVARGNAVVVTNDGRRVAADTLVAYTADAPATPAQPARMTDDPLAASGKLQKVEAFGNVTVRTVTDTATGDRAVYVPDTGIARLAGRVRITRGHNQLDGSEAEVNMKTGISRLLAGTGERVQGLVMPNDTTNPQLGWAATGGRAEVNDMRPEPQRAIGVPRRRRRRGAGRARCGQDLQEAPRGAECLDRAAARRGGGIAGPERRRQDHDVLHDRRPGEAGHRHDQPGWRRHHQPADVSPRAAWHRLSAAGGQRVPRPQCRAERDGGAGGGGARRGPARPHAGRTAGRVRHQPSAAHAGLGAVGRRAAAGGDRPRAGDAAGLHPAGRATGRHRPDRGERDPRSGVASEGSRHRRADHRP